MLLPIIAVVKIFKAHRSYSAKKAAKKKEKKKKKQKQAAVVEMAHQRPVAAARGSTFGGTNPMVDMEQGPEHSRAVVSLEPPTRRFDIDDFPSGARLRAPTGQEKRRGEDTVDRRRPQRDSNLTTLYENPTPTGSRPGGGGYVIVCSADDHF